MKQATSWLALWLLFFPGYLLSAEPSSTDDAKKLEGTWQVTKALHAAKEVNWRHWRFAFDEKQVEVTQDYFSWRGPFTLGSAAAMNTLDVQFDKHTMHLNYQWEKNQLIFVMTNYPFDKQRPSDFVSRPGDYSKFVLTLERVKTPVADKLDESARRKQARYRAGGALVRLMLAMHAYHDERGTFPAPFTQSGDGKPLLSWRVALLPYLGEEALYREFRHDESWDSEHNQKLLSRMPAVYRSVGHDPKTPHSTFYQMFVGEKCAFEPGKERTFADMVDGTVTTLGLVTASQEVAWTKPENISDTADKPLPTFLGGAIDDGLISFVTISGDVYITNNAFGEEKERLFRRLIERADGAVVTIDALDLHR